MKTIFSRNNILSALLALCTAVEYCYDLGTRFSSWYRSGGREELIKALALTITAIVWTVSTIRLGVQVVRTNGPSWISQLNDIRNTIGKQFVYAT